MSGARKAVESTARKILVYTAEIIMSIILLVIICLPLAFTIPMWLQTIGLGLPRASVILDPIAMFGMEGAFAATLALTIASFLIGYFYIYRLIPEGPSEEEDEELEEEFEEELDIDEEEADDAAFEEAIHDEENDVEEEDSE
ncbi:MAG: hypothetical protein ACFFAY_05720 [Promethearchaeota archaeon]